MVINKNMSHFNKHPTDMSYAEINRFVPSGYEKGDEMTTYLREEAAKTKANYKAYKKTGDKKYLPDNDPTKYDGSSLGG